MDNKDKQYWLQLSERYFEAETTAEEERQLRAFASTTDDPDFNALRATMGYLAVSRRKVFKARTAKSLSLTIGRYAGIAASVLLVFGLTWFMIAQRAVSEECVAYVHGQRVDDPNRVIALMQVNLQEMNIDASDDPVESQLRDMFETLK